MTTTIEEFTADVRGEVYPSSTEELTKWHEDNPMRFLGSDGRVSFSLSMEMAHKIGLANHLKCCKE